MFTKDTVLVDVDAVMYYRIFDVKMAVYEIDDLQAALCNTAQTQLKEVFGNLTFTEALQSQTDINAHLHDAIVVSTAIRLALHLAAECIALPPACERFTRLLKQAAQLRAHARQSRAD